MSDSERDERERAQRRRAQRGMSKQQRDKHNEKPKEVTIVDKKLENKFYNDLRRRRKAKGDRQWDARRVKKKQGLDAGDEVYFESESESDEDKGYDEENLTMDEVIVSLPWSYLRTRLDKLNSVSPFDAFYSYYTKHSTGPSYAFLLIFIAVFGIYTATILTRWFDQVDASETAVTMSLTEEDEGLLPSSMGFRFIPRTGLNESDVLLVDPSRVYNAVWQRCTRVPDSSTGLMSPGLETCVTISSSSCTVTSSDGVAFSSLRCPAGSEEDRTIRGSKARNGFSSTMKFLRFALRRCVNTTSDPDACEGPSVIDDRLLGSSVQFAGVSLEKPEELVDIEKTDVIVEYVKHFTHDHLPGTKQRLDMRYTFTEIIEGAVFLVDDVEAKLPVFDGYDRKEAEDTYSSQVVSTLDSADDSAAEFFVAEFFFNSHKQRVSIEPITFVDLMAQIAAMILLFYVLGFSVYLYNRWHFYKWGKFTPANLPNEYTDVLLDPRFKMQVTGFDELFQLRKENKDVETDFQLKALIGKVAGLRKALQLPIERERIRRREETQRA